MVVILLSAKELPRSRGEILRQTADQNVTSGMRSVRSTVIFFCLFCFVNAGSVLSVNSERERERNVLFNDALNTLSTVIWRQTYG